MTAAFAPNAFAALRSRVQAHLFGGLPEQLARLRWDAGRIREHQRSALRALLAHAAEHSPFHARRLRGVDPERFELADLPRLPVMTKAELMSEFDDVLTDRRIDRRAAEDALARTGSEPVPLLDEYVCLASGGSTGLRGVFVLDVSALVAFLGSLHRAMMARLAHAGGVPAGGVRVGLVAAASAVHATGSAPAWTEGGPVHFTSIPVTLPLGEIVGRLEALQPDVLYGYPSMLARLAREQRAGRLRIAPRSVTCSSESLLPEWRAEIRAAFGAPIVDVFGSSEGLVGFTEPDDPTLVFNSDCCIVELVDARGRPVPPGAASARLLLTNLANRTQPLIRYEISDRFLRRPDAPDHGHLRATVEGRADDVLRWGAVEIHPFVVRAVLVKRPEVADYQVRQTERGLELALLATAPVDLGALSAALRAALAEAGLPDAEVVARCVPALARHAETGKLRRFVAR